MIDFLTKNANTLLWGILLTSGTGALCCLSWVWLSRQWGGKDNCLKIYRWLKAVIIFWSWPLLFSGVRFYLQNRIGQGITDGIYFQRIFSNPLITEGLVLVWAAGGLLCGAYYLVRWFLDQWYLRRLPRLMEEDWRTEAREIAGKLGIRRTPDLRELPVPGSPRMTGLLRPRILLYPGEYTDLQRRSVLYHELCHYRYRDLWWQIGMSLLVCLNWFNPLCRCLHRQLREWGEAACDVRACEKGEIPLEDYYGTVFSFCRTESRAGRTCFTRAICEEGARETLIRRIERLKATRRLRRDGKRGRRWAFSTAMAGVLSLNILLITGFGLISDELSGGQVVENLEVLKDGSVRGIEVNGRTVYVAEAAPVPPAERVPGLAGQWMDLYPTVPVLDYCTWDSKDIGGAVNLSFDQPVVLCQFIVHNPVQFRMGSLSDTVPYRIAAVRNGIILDCFDVKESGGTVDFELKAGEYWFYFMDKEQTQKEIKVMWVCKEMQ